MTITDLQGRPNLRARVVPPYRSGPDVIGVRQGPDGHPFRLGPASFCGGPCAPLLSRLVRRPLARQSENSRKYWAARIYARRNQYLTPFKEHRRTFTGPSQVDPRRWLCLDATRFGRRAGFTMIRTEQRECDHSDRSQLHDAGASFDDDTGTLRVGHTTFAACKR